MLLRNHPDRIHVAFDYHLLVADASLRYLYNGKIPVSISGYVNEVEEQYVVITPSQEEHSSAYLFCYYTDTAAAVHLTKGQLITVTGRVRGDDGYTSRVSTYACTILGIDLDRNQAVSVQELRQNVVQVFCITDSFFGSDYKGTGVIIDGAEGAVLTVHHVVA